MQHSNYARLNLEPISVHLHTTHQQPMLTMLFHRLSYEQYRSKKADAKFLVHNSAVLSNEPAKSSSFLTVPLLQGLPCDPPGLSCETGTCDHNIASCMVLPCSGKGRTVSFNMTDQLRLEIVALCPSI